ncbi:MAG: DUF4876 domain-containing protein [Bacteroidetes bacterium]|uniref:DUF4876 domain-containing protein n=1 Tax=Candidatus Caccoplasma merdipullorum TaxID=2840718 RepID=A0A9D9E5L1_9BACT|nr:DUF4876 domain-containing protein [Candidatus Caccoplasma merdipullorum]
MKKKLLAIIPLAALLVMGSCKTDDDNVASYNTLTVTLSYPDGITQADITTSSVTATNVQTGAKEQLAESGAGTFTIKLTGGEYMINASAFTDNKIMNASKQISIYNNMDIEIGLKGAILNDGFVFKEVYYNMVKVKNKPYTQDQFFEIYNNSDQVQYLDNCILARLQGIQGTARVTQWVTSENGTEIMDIYALESYVVAFVGNGTKYPVNPRESVLIAATAINHNAETGGVSPVDLTNADYEVNISDYKSDTDNPAVPDMTIVTKSSSATPNFFGLPYTGNALILAQLPAGMTMDSYINDRSNYRTIPWQTVNTYEFLTVPQEYVLDGINIVNSNESKRIVRLRPEVDNGIIFMASDYAGKSIRRKVKEITPDGKVILQDTNNSSEDFLSDQTPTPGILPTTID